MELFDSLSLEQQAVINKHLELVMEANKTTNLTKIDTFEEALLLHVEDSLTGLKELEEAPVGLFGDLGSGAGYPGIPLSVATGRQTVLIDSRQKKMKILDGIIREIELSHQIETYAGRAELLARTQAEAFSALTARALAKLSVLMELASPLLRKGGHLICYKANLESSEYEHARCTQKATGLKIHSEREFKLGGVYSRKIIVFEKYATPEVKLPRLEGQAQKNPL